MIGCDVGRCQFPGRTFHSQPRNLGEFVIVHKLVRLVAPTHGKAFKSFIHAYLPDWEKREEWIKDFAGG